MRCLIGHGREVSMNLGRNRLTRCPHVAIRSSSLASLSSAVLVSLKDRGYPC